MIGWTDTHCHLQSVPEGAERVAVVERAVAEGVGRMVCVGTDAASSVAAIELATGELSGAGASPAGGVEIWATAGLHPHEASAGSAAVRALVESVLADPDRASRLVAIGECGLDYHYDHSPRPAQREEFASQVTLANEVGLTLVIHAREAFGDTLSILASEGVPSRTIFHCFTGGPADAERCLETGAYLSFSGIATFPSAEDVREAVAICPLDRILVETDSPYLAPVPHRGRPNEPGYVPLVGELVARVKGIGIAEAAALTSANAVSAFALAAG